MTTFYRVIQGERARLEDFMSYVELGKSFDESDPEARELAEGISVNATLRQARNRALGLGLGEFIAELSIPDGSPITFKRTGKTRGHHTIWGSASALLELVVSIVRVDEAGEPA